MTTTVASTRSAKNSFDLAGSTRRILGMSRYEVTLLLRNKVMLMNALILTPLMILAFTGILGRAGMLQPSDVLMMAVTWTSAFVVYINLTAIFVSRREDRVFARMETGEASKWEALIAAAIPSIVIMIIQLLIAGIAAKIMYQGPLFARPVEAILGIILVIVTFVALAAATTSITKSVEAAQITTMPVALIAVFFSGSTLPMSFLPSFVQRLAELTPLNALSALIVPGADWSLPNYAPLLILAAWAVVSVYLARRYMSFAPRR